MSIAFAANISALRREKNLTQKTAADELGISQALLSHYEKGIRECNLEFVVKAAEYYGVTADYLLGISESSASNKNSFDFSDASQDSLIHSKTLLRAMIYLQSRAQDSSEADAEHFNDYFSLAIEKYLALTLKDDTVLAELCNIPLSETQIIDNNFSDIPECVKTIDSHAVKIIINKIKKSV